MEISALGSGSSGNCFFIKNKNEAIIIDCGISAKQICERLDKIKQSAEKIKGIFITHEHTDHVKGADVFARKFNIPIFATKATMLNSNLCSNPKLINEIKNDEEISLAGMKIQAFPKFHSAIDPVSYKIIKDKTISVITDLGYASKRVHEAVLDSDFLCIESNHDIQMLENGPYPWHLKKWIKGEQGHLSNLQASVCVLEHANKRLKNIVLSHISKTNNTYDLAEKHFNNMIKERSDLKPEISVSRREEPTKLFKI
jgi:phosphoribosyl 1,2-cyclic phosphodiesterase